MPPQQRARQRLRCTGRLENKGNRDSGLLADDRGATSEGLRATAAARRPGTRCSLSVSRRAIVPRVRLILEGLTGAGKSQTLAAMGRRGLLPSVVVSEEETFGDIMEEIDAGPIASAFLVRRLASVIARVDTTPSFVLERFHLSYYALAPTWSHYAWIDDALVAANVALVLLTIPEADLRVRSLLRREHGGADWQAFGARFGSEGRRWRRSACHRSAVSKRWRYPACRASASTRARCVGMRSRRRRQPLPARAAEDTSDFACCRLPPPLVRRSRPRARVRASLVAPLPRSAHRLRGTRLRLAGALLESWPPR